MNAPWSPTRAGASQRDPFSAFICDENTAEKIRPICIEMGWQIEKINKVLSQLQKANQVPVEKKRELETEIKRIEGVING